MQHVLIVSPHFPPINAADHQRVRMALPYLKEFGWEASVLAVAAQYVEAMPLDPVLEKTVPDDLETTKTNALPFRITRMVGMGNLAVRALPFLRQAGDWLLEKSEDRSRDSDRARKFDLVFFSTTQFPVMSLGPRWKAKFHVPYVVDMQDPWLDDYYSRTGTRPPGGRLKYGISQFLARRLEPRVMRGVAHVISVSPGYVETLRERYPHLRADQFTVLPFGAPERDFELLRQMDIRQTLFDPTDGKRHWVYVGRGGADMAPALRLLFRAIQEVRSKEPQAWSNVRLHFAGTSYAPPERAVKTIEPIANECGVGDLLRETTNRLPYFETLKALTDADALLVIGSDSPSYSASKLYPYMLAGRPLVAVLHQESPAVEILRQCKVGGIVTFDPAAAERSSDVMISALRQLREEAARPRERAQEPAGDALNLDEFQNYSARQMTRRMCEVFDRAVLSDSHSSRP